MSPRLTWMERMAMAVETRFPVGPGSWMIIYLVAAGALLPSVLVLALGTGMMLYSYLTRGLYADGAHTEMSVLAVNLFCTVLGWFFSSWLVMAWRLFQSHRRGVPYSSPCLLWISGLVLLAELALFVIAMAVTGLNAYWSLLAVGLMVLIWQTHQRHCRKR